MSRDQPGLCWKSAYDTLEAGRVVLAPDLIGVPPVPDKLDGASDNKGTVEALLNAAVAWTRKDWTTLGRVFEILGVYLDQPFMLDEQDSRNIYGASWVNCPVAILLAMARARGEIALAEKGGARHGVPLAARLALGSAGCSVREIPSGQRGRLFPALAGGLVADGPVVGSGLDATGLPAKRTWVRGNGGLLDDVAGVAIEYPILLAMVRARQHSLPREFRNNVGVRTLRIVEKIAPGTWLWGLTAEDRAKVESYCIARPDKRWLARMLELSEQNRAKARIAARRFERGYLAFYPSVSYGSTCALGIIGYREPTAIGHYASPSNGDRGGGSFVSAWEGEHAAVAWRDGLRCRVELPASEVGNRVLDYEFGGDSEPTIDGRSYREFLGAAQPSSPSPPPPTTEPRKENKWTDWL